MGSKGERERSESGKCEWTHIVNTRTAENYCKVTTVDGATTDFPSRAYTRTGTICGPRFFPCSVAVSNAHIALRGNTAVKLIDSHVFLLFQYLSRWLSHAASHYPKDKSIFCLITAVYIHRSLRYYGIRERGIYNKLIIIILNERCHYRRIRINHTFGC